MRPLDPGTFLDEFVAQTPLPEGIRLVYEHPGPLAPISADPLALSRALTNLISNACAAMDGHGTLRITATRCAIEVADSGPGIPPHMCKRIFDPFFTTKGERGTGLGLAIVRDVMRRHGGSVMVQSEPGRGASFTLRFRAASRQ